MSYSQYLPFEDSFLAGNITPPVDPPLNTTPGGLFIVWLIFGLTLMTIAGILYVSIKDIIKST